ncbi:MAG: putative metal-binding motif-containing protein, partial [Deltaproteobacteria bacterium]|nr:putative metal-binding motif-containing protein [Deltaproteobacteria bacterium]
MLLLFLACGADNVVKSSNEAPIVTILRPVDGSSFDPALPVELCAQIEDETAAAKLAITVQSDVDGVLLELAAGDGRDACEGGNVGLSLDLSDGDHVLSVFASDEDGDIGEASVVVIAEANTAPECSFALPYAGTVLRVGESVDVAVGTTDAQSDPALLTAVLASDIDGTFWSGSPDSAGTVTTRFSPLAGGEHRLSMTLTDPGGLVGTCVVDIDVEACLDDDRDGATTCDDEDCDDDNDTVYAGAEELADGLDNDCDGETDEGTDYKDDDGDGYREIDGDCDDGDATEYPGAPDTWYDGRDADCAGDDDYDQDGDGHQVSGIGDDCWDLDASIYPGATDAWYDGVDSNCDGASDFDQDGDGQDASFAGGADCDD